MALVIYSIFLLGAVLSFLEDYMSKRDKAITLLVLAVIMIVTAGVRDTLATRDSAMYEYMFYGGGNAIVQELTEPTFTFIASTILALGGTINVLFFVYAIINIPTKGAVMLKLTSLPILTFTVYISYLYMLHDLIQIRAGAAVAFVACAIYMLAKGKRLFALGFVLIATMFHFSAIMTILLLLITNKPLGTKGRIALACVLPLGFAIYLTNFNIINMIPDFIGGDKVELYKAQSDTGLMETSNVFVEVYYLIKYVTFLVTLLFYELLAEKNKNLPLMIKIQALSIFIYCLFAKINAVLAFRSSELFCFVDCILLAYLSYLIKPYWIGKLLVICAGLALLLWYTLVIDYVTF